MKKILSLIVFVTLSVFVCGQPFSRYFEYDNAGNRVLRTQIDLRQPVQDSLATDSTFSAKMENFAEQNFEKIKRDDYMEGIAPVNTDTREEDTYYEEQVGNITVHVFPNPTTQKITLRIDNYPDLVKGELLLYNISGQFIRKYAITAYSTELNLSDYPGGTYLLRLQMNNYHDEWKIIKN